MDFQKRNSQIVMVIIAVVAAIALAGAVYWWKVYRAAPTTSPVAQAPTPSSEPASHILVGVRVDPTLDDRSDESDRSIQYKLLSVDSQTSIGQNLDSIQANIFSSSFAYGDDNVYFVNGDGELSTYHIPSKKTALLALPDIKPVFGFLDDHSVSNFLLSGSTLVYLQGQCTDGAVCHLRQYDLVTKKMTSIIDHLEKKLLLVGDTTVSIESYDTAKQTMTLLKTRNTGDGGFADVVDVSLATHATNVAKTVEFTNDAQNAAAEEIFTKRLTCGSASASQNVVDIPGTGDADIQTSITSSRGEVTKYMPAYIVGCVMPK